MEDNRRTKIGKTIKVLDHGYVRLVDFMGSDERIVEAARISYNSPSKGEAQDKKLLRYLYKNSHTSPFEQVKIALNIKMPIFIMRQYVRHRMQNLNEVSARYTQLPNEFYIPSNWRRQDLKNKQGSVIGEDFNPDVNVIVIEGCSEKTIPATKALTDHCYRSYDLYEEMIKSGIAREMARMVLPVNIYTEIYTTWDLKNLLHFIALRDDSHAQAEIQEYGKAIKEICNDIFPWTMEVYEEIQSNKS